MVVVDAYVGVALDGRVYMLVLMLMLDVVVASARLPVRRNWKNNWKNWKNQGSNTGGSCFLF